MGTHDAVEWPLFTWLRMPGFEVTFGVRLDGLSWMLFALTTIVLLLILSAWPRGKSQAWLWLAWLGVLLANVAGNLGQMFFGWMLSAWASSELARGNGESHSTFRPVWLVQRVSDMALLGGFGLIWMNFDSSLEFSAWTPEAIATLRPELVESIALCVLVGVIGRCAQLPLTVWLETEAGFAAQAGSSMTKLSDEMVGLWNVPDGHHVAERLKSDPTARWHALPEGSVPSAVLAWWLSAAFLPVGIGLLIRMEPLLAVAPHTRLLMVAVGAFTLLMCSANAVAQNNWPRVLSQLAVGQCGLALMALGTSQPQADWSAMMMVLWQSVFWTVLLVANQRNSRAVALAVFCLASGLWGRHSVVNLVWGQAWPELRVVDSESMVFGATESRVWPLVGAMMCLAELLTSLALLRAWFLRRREVTTSESTSPTVLVVVRLTVGLLLVGATLSDLGSVQSGRSPLLAVSPLLPLSATGAVLAWWLYSRPSSLPEKLSAAFGPFARLSRNRFYWDDLYFLLLVHPMTAAGEFFVWLEERVFGRALRSWRSKAANFVAESAEPLSRGSAMVRALTTVGSVVVLAWMLLWLRS